MNLTQKVLIALLLGLLVGLLFNITGLSAEGTFVHKYFTDGLFLVVGKMFVNALKMLVVPLVVFSLITGIMGIGDIRLLGRVGSKSFIFYVATTAIAIASALTFAAVSGIGTGMDSSSLQEFAGKEAPAFTDVITGIVPSNAIAAMANADMLAVIFFAICFGISLLSVAKEAESVVTLMEQLNAVMMKMVTLVMHFAPYAVFCLIAKAISDLGLELLEQLGKYFVLLVFVLLLHGGVTLMLILRFVGKLDVAVFLKKMRAAQLFAFSTSSSGATIPVTLRSVQERLGVDRSIASFTVPFGATINMDGTAIMQGVATVFIANVYGIEMGMVEYLTVVVMAVLASIGTAAVPGVGLIMLTMVFDQVGLPVEGIGLILGVDRLLDMLRTSVNITGDAVVSCLVAKGEGKIDIDTYRNPDAGAIES